MGRRSRSRIRAGLQEPTGGCEHSGHSDAGGSWGSDHVRLVEHHFSQALRMFHLGEGAHADPELTELADLWCDGMGGVADASPPVVPALLWSHLCDKIEPTWERGWQPADISRIVRRKLSANHGQLAVDVIADQAQSYRCRQRTLPSWMDQLEQIGATVRWRAGTDHLALFALENGIDLESLLRIGFELLVMFHNLPTILRLDPPPSEWDTSAALDAAVAWRESEGAKERRHLELIRALLAKAESTEFEEEAEAFTEKAQELMTRYSIDAALLAAHSAGESAGPRPGGIRIGIDDPYSQAKAVLLSRIANASGCRAVWTKALGFSTVFGFEAERKSVNLLYASLLVQADKAMMRIGKDGGHARSRSFRNSFLAGFAYRIGQRLEEAASAVVCDVVKERGDDLLPVLAERSQEVDNCRDEAFPELGVFKSSVSDWSAWVSGTEAADIADIMRGPLLDQMTHS